MPDAGPIAVLPHRPLTVGELLDSAVLLLRAQARVLVPIALVLAAAEQFLVLQPLRLAAGTVPPIWWMSGGSFGTYWLLLAAGAATEAMIIMLLGNPAARAGAAALLGRTTLPGEVLRPAGGRWGGTALFMLVVGVLMYAAAFCGPLWFVGFALLGALAPALVVDRVPLPRVLSRATALATRAGLRAGMIRLLGYLGWWILRVGLASGIILGLPRLGLIDDYWALPVALLVWAAVNGVAYPALACLDAVLHLETRIRTEGLDLLLARAPAGTPEPVLLAAER
ncbi:hypothetical protein E1211_23930 [Micromonospora sp. 15K316]|uniref:hypothetical protein n=1 Tax=Micromonospora sp. 15K316 TaxID=2530376 RepID=UPI00104F212E|nr:hypothetical protein [Micromonospora sp. 15K316]TDC30579.1 hypothetical protein E1211_23930 [Micromonospora sp. 15K316]